ncbi:hypothetical protein HYU90_01975 [Candidatus Collierbacteria bacterium]|nr:hypothetical protein [Candidatus Collierbacteria bacterium]
MTATLMNLYPGRVVVIKKDFGLVPVDEITRDVIAFATETYAITASGILLTGLDKGGVIQQKRMLSPDKYHISAKARRTKSALTLALEAPYLELDED